MQTRADQSTRKLDELQKSFESKFAEVTKQLDQVTVQKAFPGLGKQLYVIYDLKPWKGKSEKTPTDRWVNIYLAPQALPEFTSQEMTAFEQMLRKNGFTALPGSFGVAGPYQTGFGYFDRSTRVYYFNESKREDALQVAKMMQQTLGIPNVAVEYVNPAFQIPVDRLVIEQSGLDLQVFITGADK